MKNKKRSVIKILLCYNTYHKISKKTISKISGVDIKEIDKFLVLKKSKISIEDKYKLAVTTMSLRFFLKDIENLKLVIYIRS